MSTNAPSISRCHSHQEACQFRPQAIAISASASRVNAPAMASGQRGRRVPRQTQVAHDGDGVEGHTEDRQHDQRAATPARPRGCGGRARATRGTPRPTRASGRPVPTAATGRGSSRPAPASSERSRLDAAANPAATSSPTGVASAKPAFVVGRSTPGVASACRPRKPAAERKASDTRKTRASPRSRAADPVAYASTALTAPAASTIQKCAGWCCHAHVELGARDEQGEAEHRQRERGAHEPEPPRVDGRRSGARPRDGRLRLRGAHGPRARSASVPAAGGRGPRRPRPTPHRPRRRPA